MDSARREALADSVLARSTATQTEVSVFSSNSELTRFTHNAVHQNVAESNVAVRVRAVIGGRTGVATTNALDENALNDVVRRAIDLANLSPEDPDQPQLPPGGTIIPSEGAYVEQTAHATPLQRANMADAIFKAAQDHDYWCAGYVTTSADGVTVVNSNGARASFESTDAGINVKMNSPDSSGFAEAYNNDVNELDAARVGETSARKASDSAHPGEVEPGPWTVILEPAAFGELFAYLAAHFSAQSYEEQSSFLSDGLGKPYLGENVTIEDDYAHPLNPAMPFDFEGQPKQRVTLIERGVAKNVVTDSYYAARLHMPNTGHALPAPNAYGPQTSNLVVAPGSKPATQLIAETKRGLLITRFWYIRIVDQKKAIVTGMTRDGTFLIENGAVVRGVHNMRFNQSILETLRHCEFGNALHRTGSYSYSIVVPAAKIENFHFSSGTNF